MRKVLFILGELSDSDIEWLAAAGDRKTFRASSVLIQEGKSIDEMFLLLDGQLSVNVSGAHKELRINTLQKGEIVGELSFLDSRPPSASVTAATDSTVLALSCAILKRKMARDSGFAARFYRALGVFLADRLRNTVHLLGYGVAGSDSLHQDDDSAGELDPALLESLAIAAKRFELLVDRLKTKSMENG